MLRDTERERFEKIARSAAALVNTIYEFDFDPQTIDEPLNELDDLLVEAGYRPAPEPLDVDKWLEERVKESEEFRKREGL